MLKFQRGKLVECRIIDRELPYDPKLKPIYEFPECGIFRDVLDSIRREVNLINVVNINKVIEAHPRFEKETTIKCLLISKRYYQYIVENLLDENGNYRKIKVEIDQKYFKKLMIDEMKLMRDIY
jgi:hypothetical protein